MKAKNRTITVSLLFVLSMEIFSNNARAVIGYSDAAPNTSPPTGTLANSGWQYEVKFGNATGTIIGPYTFITATHVGGSPNYQEVLYHYAGSEYHNWTIRSIPDPTGSITIWVCVNQFLQQGASVYSGSSEAGQSVVVYGRSANWKGTTIYAGGSFRGWAEAENYLPITPELYKPEITWATTTVESANGSFLNFVFRSGNSCLTSEGDSGGGIFIYSGGYWQLAGINQGTDELAWGFTGADSPNQNICGRMILIDQLGLYRFDAINGNCSNASFIPVSANLTWNAWQLSQFSTFINANWNASGY